MFCQETALLSVQIFSAVRFAMLCLLNSPMQRSRGVPLLIRDLSSLDSLVLLSGVRNRGRQGRFHKREVREQNWIRRRFQI